MKGDKEMEERTMKQLLMSSNYFVLNKQLIKILGIETAFLLTALIENSDSLADDEGWFYRTASALEEETGLTNHKQTTCINKLIELGILQQENKGTPCKRYFKISFEEIENLVFKKTETSFQKNEKLDLKKFENQSSKNLKTSFEEIEKPYNNINNNININNNNLDNNKLNKNNLNKELNNIYSKIIQYLNSKAGTNYREDTAKTKNLIKARLNEKFALEDFLLVIDKKCDEWLNTEMEKYLRPETLFGTKFESYLNAKHITKSEEKRIEQQSKITRLQVNSNYLEEMKERYKL